MNESVESPNSESLGKQFNSLAEMNEAMKVSKKEGQDWGSQYLVIYGKRLHKFPPKIEGGSAYYDLVDDPSVSIKAMFGRQYDDRFSMNIYEGQKIVYWFNLTNENVGSYNIEVSQINYKDYKPS